MGGRSAAWEVGPVVESSQVRSHAWWAFAGGVRHREGVRIDVTL